MRILLIRHGQTDLNVQKRLQGSSEIPLNARGRQQANETRKFVLENCLVPTKVISSPLGRAVETGCIVAGVTPKDVEIDENLIEMSFGIYEQQDMEKVNPQFIIECFDHPDGYKPPEGAECYDEVLARAERVIERLRTRIALGEFKEDDIIMLVSHGALSHGIFEYLKKTPRSEYWNVDFNNCAIAELLLSDDGMSDDYIFISNGFEKNW